MNREEAKAWLEHHFDPIPDGTKQSEAVSLAIKALEQEQCEDAVSREAVCNIVNDIRDCISVEGYWAILERLKKLPSVNPQPKTGHWIEVAKYPDGKHKIKCSECERHIFDRGHANSYVVKEKYKYCPRCGAKMVDPQESEVQE